MINEHDIRDLCLRVKAEMPAVDSKNEAEYLQKYTETLCRILAEKCDKAWYYDAANLIRHAVGIPISVVSKSEIIAIQQRMNMRDYEEDL
jgi:hypothetical protein